MSLRDAVEAVSKIERQYRSSPVDRELAAKLIGYSSASGPANKSLAALATYGLLERAGKGETRVTPRARAIIHPNNENERTESLLAAASEPDLFRELRERFQGIAIPPEEGVVSFLNRQGFNPSAVRPAAKAFLQTMAYVEELSVSDSHGIGSPNETESQSPEAARRSTYGGAKKGDFIQWESQGTLQFEKPVRVRAVSDDGNWVAVEDSKVGIPMNEVLVETLAPTGGKEAPIFAFTDNQVLPPERGETEWMRNQLSQETNVRLLVKGDIGPKEIGKLIKLLEAQKSILEDD